MAVTYFRAEIKFGSFHPKEGNHFTATKKDHEWMEDSTTMLEDKSISVLNPLDDDDDDDLMQSARFQKMAATMDAGLQSILGGMGSAPDVDYKGPPHHEMYVPAAATKR